MRRHLPTNFIIDGVELCYVAVELELVPALSDCIATLAHVVFKLDGFEVAELLVSQRAVAGDLALEVQEGHRATLAQDCHVDVVYTDCAEQSSVGGVSV